MLTMTRSVCCVSLFLKYSFTYNENQVFTYNENQVLYIMRTKFSIAYQCRLLITFANRLDPDQARQYVGLIRIQSVWHSDGIPEFFEKVDFEKKTQTTKSMRIFPAFKELMVSKTMTEASATRYNVNWNRLLLFPRHNKNHHSSR